MKAPVVLDLGVPKLARNVGDEVKVEVAFYFYEIPDCGWWDTVWQAGIQIVGPDSTTRQVSELTPIVVGKRETFSLTERIASAGGYHISAWVVAGTPKPDMEPKSDRGEAFAFYAAGRETTFTVISTEPPDTGWHKLSKSSALVKRLDGMGPPGEGQKMTVSKGGDFDYGIGSKRGSDSSVCRLHILPYSVEPLRSVVLGDFAIEPQSKRVFELDGITKIDSVRISDPRLGVVTVLNDRAFLLTTSGDRGSASISVYEKDRTYTLFLNRNRQTFNVNGIFEFRNETGGLLPAGFMYTAIYYQDGFGDWQIENEGFTSSTGYVSLQCTQTQFEIWVSSKFAGATVFFSPDHQFGSGYVYAYGRGVSVTNPQHQNVDLDTQYTYERRLSVAGAFNIARALKSGLEAFDNKVGAYPSPTWVPVLWDSACSQNLTANYGYFLVDDVKAIFLRGQESLDTNRDEWDYPVILHEWSHKIMNEYAALDTLASGDHGYYYPAYMGTDAWRSKILAYSEGWADFFQAVLRGIPDLYDRINNGVKVLDIQLERPSPDVPYVLTGWQGAPSNSTPYYNGADVEGSVAEALWDLYDKVDDDNYLVYGQIWGHNNDHNTSDSWSGIDAIWDVFWDYDPWPDFAGQQYCNSIKQFIAGWGSKGYPVGGHFRDILLAHAIDVCTSCGDANSDGSIDISDVVFLIAHIFSGGTPPGVCNYAKGKGDANGDGSVDISDVVYLIARVFSHGPAPHCQ